jgi:hypothetical protein
MYRFQQQVGGLPTRHPKPDLRTVKNSQISTLSLPMFPNKLAMIKEGTFLYYVLPGENKNENNEPGIIEMAIDQEEL